eukprot:CAMPEP_0170515418 /NCGR_PEP_ID=MMETSP0209-20121228/1857_1 /TAXON_ID=665100 ORGANISM="Litonotus pictus, Strain P1" /NCGR_SAMPLE_ID=MMETSP0209 /ASSEMBLY_ACC=CAM_ASM_000301 /LENGTH=335 /DNA_ID=CAMNT_0010799901 /DNA_START=116 /DNA_END=1120 /DNA_ORIENTATION=-
MRNVNSKVKAEMINKIKQLNFLSSSINEGFFSQKSNQSSQLKSRKALSLTKIETGVTAPENQTEDFYDQNNVNIPTFSNLGFKCVGKEGFLAMKITKKGFGCISDGKDACKKHKSKVDCLASISNNSGNVNTVTTIDEAQTEAAKSFFFNRWICPSESGLRVPVMVSMKDNVFTINCLKSKNGEDCVYDHNAEVHCNKIAACENDLSKDYSSLTCGTEEIKGKFSHDGYNTKTPFWCKTAYAWLKFDGEVTISKDKNRATVLLPNGYKGCISKENGIVCLSEEEKLNKQISSISSDKTKYPKFIECSASNMMLLVGSDSSHWCASLDMTYNEKGE